MAKTYDGNNIQDTCPCPSVSVSAVRFLKKIMFDKKCVYNLGFKVSSYIIKLRLHLRRLDNSN